MHEEYIHRIEVHVAGICIDGDKVLVVKRTPSRRLYPNLWECGGGQVESGESFEDAIKRQLRDELGVIAEPIAFVRTYEIPTPNEQQKKIPGVKFICKVIGFVNGKEPVISSEHTEWKWQPINDLGELKFIPGVDDDIRKAYQLSKQVHRE